jgi:hypothetical protein
MQFTQISGAPMLYTGSSNGMLLYLLPKSQSYPGGPIDFSDSWSTYSGWYIFLAQPLVSGTETTFAEAAWAFLTTPQMAGVRFAWINPPDGSGLLSGNTLGVQTSGNNAYVTNADVTFTFSQISVFITGGTPFAPDFDNFGFILTQTDSQPIYISANFGSATIPATSNLTLPLTGNLAGCVQFASALSTQNLTDLDISLRYFYAIPPDMQNPDVQVPNYTLGSLRYPVFNEGMTLYANMDPLQALTAGRTFLAFNGADAGQTGAATPVGSNYSSILGDPFTLLPQSGAALVFQVNQQANLHNNQDPLYLVPSGNFALQADRKPTVNLMCGLSGVEYIQLSNPNPATPTNIVTFYPGNTAYAEGFNPQLLPGHPQLTPADLPTTSFASVTTASNALPYFAQPDQSVLYNLQGTPGTVLSLSPVPVEAATIPTPNSSPVIFPLLPYSSALAGLDLDAYNQLETQVANPLRRQAMAAPNAGLPAPTQTITTPSVTPQGLLVNYILPFQNPKVPTWQSVVLAQMDQLIPPVPPSKTPTIQPAQFALSNVTGPLLQAFESNQLFLVISNPSAIQQQLQSNPKIYIGADTGQQWTFDITPGANWNALDTIVIVKFADLALKDLAAQTSTWSSPTTFNSNPNQTSANITSIINAAMNSGDPDFATFINAVTEPSWNGVLILNAASPLTSLPAQLAGLAAGINASQFFAHHVGINASKVITTTDPKTGKPVLGIANSSIFGLINYAVDPPGPTTADYAFTVETLKVLFVNSAVADFSSKIDLQINQLFGEPASLFGNPSNIVQMFGVYQSQDVNGTQQDSYSFQTADGAISTFNMTSQVLNAVTISKGQFVTITSTSSATQTQSQFVFWGLLDFRSLKNFDIFSFGRDSGDGDPKVTAKGLNYANLAIDMTYTPGPPAVTTYNFDASTLTFDLAGSYIRTGGFYNHFPLTLAGFTQAAQGVSPADAGFMGVQSPLNQSNLSYPWFSINFNLNLGTPGALAADVGFVASLTAAWSPNAGVDYRVFTGLKMPGSVGTKRQISIEGIFNINFKTLEIIAVPASNTYILVLYGIAFSFLSFNFPPSGQVNFVLFGNPNPTPGDTTLGWYAAYAKEGTKTDGGGSGDKALKAAPIPVALLSGPDSCN